MAVELVGFHLPFFSSRRRHTRCLSDWSSDVCSSDLYTAGRSDVWRLPQSTLRRWPMTPAMRAGYSCRPLETKLMLGSHLLLHFVFCDIDAGAFLPLNHRSLVDNRPAGTQQFIQSLLT